jgi:hypothetical protein
MLMSFSEALLRIKLGHKMTRKSWHGFADKNWNAKTRKFVYLVKGSEFEVNRPPLNAMYEMGTVIKYRPHIDLADGEGTCGVWSASNEDILAEDWEILDE